MIFLLECIAACALFTLVLELMAARRREVFTNDYPPVVTDKLRALQLVAETPPTKKSGMHGISAVAGGGLVRFPGGGCAAGTL